MASDIDILRGLAGRVREIADLPETAGRRLRWRRHNALEPERPLVLAIPEGAWTELLPDSVLQCTDPELRVWEHTLRGKIFQQERIRDDAAIDPWFNIGWRVTAADETFGVDVPKTHGDNRGSYRWDPPIKDIDRDIPRLRPRRPAVDREATRRRMERAAELFGDLLPPRIRGAHWWTAGLTQSAIMLVGLENLMVLMVDAPKAVHKLMAWLRDEQLQYMDWFEKEGLLALNNEGDYIASGGQGYSDQLPAPGGDGRTRLADLWGFAESQETVGVSPGMFGEFVFPYQMPLMEKFGLNCYGCCEGLHQRVEYLMKVPRLRRVSVAPWADQKALAERLGNRYVYSRKPNPALVCGAFDERAIRADLAFTLEVAGRGALEIILKDTHTVQNEAWRIPRWVEIAREEVDRYMDAMGK
jgi:hypothetical protein